MTSRTMAMVAAAALAGFALWVALFDAPWERPSATPSPVILQWTEGAKAQCQSALSLRSEMVLLTLRGQPVNSTYYRNTMTTVNSLIRRYC